MKKIVLFLFLCIGLGLWSGCQSFQGTQFAPLDARLGFAGNGGGRSLVLVNSSGQALHNVYFQAYMWCKGQPTQNQQPTLLMSVNEQPEPVPTQTYTFTGSSAKLGPGETIHTVGNNTVGDNQILESVTKVQVSGKCDEGAFRETWLMSDNGQLELVGVPKD